MGRDGMTGSPVVRFVGISTRFCAGLVAVLFIVEALLHWRNVRQHGRQLLTRDVYQVVESAHRPDPRVTRLCVGDSVARQFFRPGHEPNSRVRYLATNQTVSLAGHYYLVRDALPQCPNVREVDLFLFYGSWRNDLSGPLPHDYFCGHFHSLDEVAEVFDVRRDFSLSAAHLGRVLLPNLMAENSRWRGGQTLNLRFSPVASVTPTDKSEPVLSMLSQLCRRHDEGNPIVPSDMTTVQVCTLAWHYLARLRELCHARGVRLRVLPTPCPDDRRLVGADRVYDSDATMLYLDPAEFRDGIHFKPESIDRVRARVIETYGLDWAR
jgi:hypothetical protein